MTQTEFHISRRAYLQASAALPILGLRGFSSTGQAVDSSRLGKITDHLTKGASAQRPHVLAWGGGANLFNPNHMDDISDREKISTILSVHPDNFWSTRIVGFQGPPSETFLVGDARHQINIGTRYGFSPVVGRMGEFGTDDREGEWYQSLPSDRKWRYPNGSLVQDHVQTASKHIDGSPIKIDSRLEGEAFTFEPSKHIEGVRDFYANIAEDVIEFGGNGIWIDGGTNWGQRDYSVWAKENLRQHIESLSEEKRQSIGVEDPSSIDLFAEIRSRTPPNSGKNPAKDPLWREFVKQDYLAIRESFQNVIDRVNDQYPNKDTVVFSNQSSFLDLPELPALTGDPLTFLGVEAQLTLPPNFVFDFVHKAIAASGRFQGPAFHMGTTMVREEAIDAVRSSDLDTSIVQTDLIATQFAEQVANGAIGTVALSGDYNVGTLEDIPGNWMDENAKIPAAAKEVTAFTWANRELLREGKMLNSTAVILSLPTFMWNRAEEWDISNDAQSASFAGACQLVRKAGLPYDVVVFGHPDIWDDEDMLERLRNYDTIVLPRVECISPSQLSVLEEVANDGVNILMTDGFPTRDHKYEELDGGSLDVTNENIKIVEGNPARSHWEEGTKGTKFTEALPKSKVSANSTHPLGITVRGEDSNERSRTIIQVINYDFDLDSGETTDASDVTLSVNFPHDLNAVRVHRPGKQPVDISTGQELTLPAVDQWAVVVVGEDNHGIQKSTGANSEAVIDSAKNELRSAEHSGRTYGVSIGKTLTERARTANYYGATELSLDIGEAAIEAAQMAVKPPIIGIDTSHGQAASGHGWDEFEKLRSLLPQLHFRKIESWSHDVFDSIDVLILPAVNNYDTGSYGFTTSEVNLLLSFIDAGGSVVLLGTTSIANDINEITAELGVSFDGRPIVDGQADTYSVKMNRFEYHDVSRTSPSLDSRFITGISLPDHAKILLTASAGWLESQGQVEEQDPGDEPVGNLPVSGLFEYGQGLVFVHGSSHDFSHLEFDHGPVSTYSQNMIKYLGWETLLSQRISQSENLSPTLNETSTPTEVNTERSNPGTTSKTTPGFGFGTMVSSVVAGVTLLKRYFKQRDLE